MRLRRKHARKTSFFSRFTFIFESGINCPSKAWVWEKTFSRISLLFFCCNQTKNASVESVEFFSLLFAKNVIHTWSPNEIIFINLIPRKTFLVSSLNDVLRKWTTGRSREATKERFGRKLFQNSMFQNFFFMLLTVLWMTFFCETPTTLYLLSGRK